MANSRLASFLPALLLPVSVVDISACNQQQPAPIGPVDVSDPVAFTQTITSTCGPADPVGSTDHPGGASACSAGQYTTTSEVTVTIPDTLSANLTADDTNDLIQIQFSNGPICGYRTTSADTFTFSGGDSTSCTSQEAMTIPASTTVTLYINGGNNSGSETINLVLNGYVN